MTDETRIFYWEKFYSDNLKSQVEKKGEAYIEWNSIKSEVIKQVNYLRSHYKMKVEWFEKYDGCFSLFIKPKTEQYQ